LEGLGFRAIGRLLGISHGTVYQWVKKLGESAGLPSTEESVAVVELDEIHSYVGRKKTIAEVGLLLINMDTESSVLFVGNATQRLSVGCGAN